MLCEGEKAIDFELPDSAGKPVRLSDFTGKLIILYFYPRDNTPGCTKEACSFRDAFSELTAAGAEIIGISPDSISQHQSFADKYNLKFHLLSDTSHTVTAKYGAWGMKKLYGKQYYGIIRSTFIIEGTFHILKVYPKVSPGGHADEILQFIKTYKE